MIFESCHDVVHHDKLKRDDWSFRERKDLCLSETFFRCFFFLVGWSRISSKVSLTHVSRDGGKNVNLFRVLRKLPTRDFLRPLRIFVRVIKFFISCATSYTHFDPRERPVLVAPTLSTPFWISLFQKFLDVWFISNAVIERTIACCCCLCGAQPRNGDSHDPRRPASHPAARAGSPRRHPPRCASLLSGGAHAPFILWHGHPLRG
jgi:hypothetical protein